MCNTWNRRKEVPYPTPPRFRFRTQVRILVAAPLQMNNRIFQFILETDHRLFENKFEAQLSLRNSRY